MAFQKATGLTVDGKAGKNTLVKLESYFDSNGNVTQPMITPKPTADLDNIAYGIPTRTLREGMGGQDVLYTQDRLAALGYLTGISDGQYGAATKAAVLAFQKKNGLSADGVLGTNTRKRLFSEGAIGAKETSQPDGVGERKLTLGMKGDDVEERADEADCAGLPDGQGGRRVWHGDGKRDSPLPDAQWAYVRRHLRRGHGQGAVQQHRD